MADNTQKPVQDRRTFLKIGAGVIAGAAVASVVEIPYYNSVVGGNNNSSSTTVSSLQNQLQATESQLSDTQSSLNSAQGTISTLNNQLSSSQSQLSSTQSQLSAANSQLGSAQNALNSANSQNTSLGQQLQTAQGSITSANQQISTLQSQVTSSNGQITSLKSEVLAYSGNSDALTTLGVMEAAVVAAAAETIIPNDSNGPGANEAGVIYFIDRQLNGDYGNNGRMYNPGPFIQPNTKGPLTVTDLTGTPVTYSAGTPALAWTTGTEYQYGMSLRNFWRYGILALESYANSAYGGNFETLSAPNQLTCLQDLFNNKPVTAQFNNIVPSDFANELFFMVWAGFLMDPMYGGNRGMVGWTLTASPGLNNGNFYGEGLTTKQLMVATTPTILKPVSLAQYQQQFGVKGVLGGQ